MESYVQITNEAAAKMIINGELGGLWYRSPGAFGISPLWNNRVDISNLETFKFFVKLEDGKNED